MSAAAPNARENTSPPERSNRQAEEDIKVHKERETKDDGRYIIFYGFDDEDTKGRD